MSKLLIIASGLKARVSSLANCDGCRREQVLQERLLLSRLGAAAINAFSCLVWSLEQAKIDYECVIHGEEFRLLHASVNSRCLQGRERRAPI